MRRKVLVYEDDGTMEFSPPIDSSEVDFKTWYPPERYDTLPEIDNDEAVEEYEVTLKAWLKACSNISNEAM